MTRLILARYGALELKQAYQKHLGLALMFAGLAHIIAIFGLLYYGQTTAEPTVIPEPNPIPRDSVVLYPPPSITLTHGTQTPVAGPDVPKPTIGIPKPVPDVEAPEGSNIASQSEMDRFNASDLKGIVDGSAGEIVFDTTQPEILPQPEEFVPYDEPPVPLTEGTYEYPPIAKQADIEGTVWIKALVDKNGDVRDAFVFKSSGSPVGFDEVAKEAAFMIKYKPAISNNQPVAVWVVYPVCFKLR